MNRAALARLTASGRFSLFWLLRDLNSRLTAHDSGDRSHPQGWRSLRGLSNTQGTERERYEVVAFFLVGGVFWSL